MWNIGLRSLGVGAFAAAAGYYLAIHARCHSDNPAPEAVTQPARVYGDWARDTCACRSHDCLQKQKRNFDALYSIYRDAQSQVAASANRSIERGSECLDRIAYDLRKRANEARR